MSSASVNGQLRIAFSEMGGESWLGGRSYLSGVLSAVHHTYGSRIALYALNSTSVAPDNPDYIHPLTISYPPRGSVQWGLNFFKRSVFNRDLREETLLRHDIRLLFGTSFGKSFRNIATLWWLPDFQHLHLPEMFTSDEIANRTDTFRREAELATRIIVLSESVRDDFNRFAPDLAHKVGILNPVTLIPNTVYQANPLDICRVYHLPESFIYLPNQFWKHKNHNTFFEALAKLKQRGIVAHVVCTGFPHDYRNPDWFASLWQQLASNDISASITYLGVVPKSHVYALMRQSLFVVNPSRFEGWGQTAAEANALGKPVLVSDIPVHHEQQFRAPTFFDPGNSDNLAAKLEMLLATCTPGSCADAETDARKRANAHAEQTARAFWSICEEVLTTA